MPAKEHLIGAQFCADFFPFRQAIVFDANYSAPSARLDELVIEAPFIADRADGGRPNVYGPSRVAQFVAQTRRQTAFEFHDCRSCRLLKRYSPASPQLQSEVHE